MPLEHNVCAAQFLVQVDPALPSIVQRLVDTPHARPLRLVICGSSQRMMHGLVLDETAPLYGRAAEIIKVTPMPPAALPEALGLTPEQAVIAYSVWGGLPRNWELAADYPGTEEALAALLLDRNGVLHGEPPRLLLGRHAQRGSGQLPAHADRLGCHRLSENRSVGAPFRPRGRGVGAAGEGFGPSAVMPSRRGPFR